MKKLLNIIFYTIFFMLLICSVGSAQKSTAVIDSIRKVEIDLKIYSDSMYKASDETTRNAALAAFNPVIWDLLLKPEVLNYPFDSLKSLSKIKSKDGKIRIYTWMMPSRTEGTFTYYGAVQIYNSINGKVRRIGLTEKKYDASEVVDSLLLPEAWYGALYYDIIEKKINKKTYYFLLGWHGNDRLTTRKIIDVLYLDEFGDIKFGAPVFKDLKEKFKHRVIFEYDANAVMVLRYESKRKRIVFDHLSPSNPAAKGQFRYYGPDFTYDGYIFKKGIWNYKSNIELRNEK